MSRVNFGKPINCGKRITFYKTLIKAHEAVISPLMLLYLSMPWLVKKNCSDITFEKIFLFWFYSNYIFTFYLYPFVLGLRLKRESKNFRRASRTTWGFEHYVMIKLEASTWGFEHQIKTKLEASTWGFEHYIMIKLEAST